MLKGVISGFNADMLVTRREGVSKQIRHQMEQRAESFGEHHSKALSEILIFSPFSCLTCFFALNDCSTHQESL